MLQLIEEMQLLKRFCVCYKMFKNTSLMEHLRGASIYCTQQIICMVYEKCNVMYPCVHKQCTVLSRYF